MTISAVVPDIAFSGSSGSGTMGPFSLIKNGTPLVFYANSEVVVLRYDSVTDTTPTLLTEGTHYTLTGGPTAGSITLTSPSTGLLTAERLYVTTVSALAQALDLVNGGNFSSANLERRLDVIFQILQQHARDIKSTVRFAMFDTDEIPRTMPLGAVIDKIPYVTGTPSAPTVAYLDALVLNDLSELSDNALADIAVVAADLASADTIGIVAAAIDDVEDVAAAIADVETVADSINDGSFATKRNVLTGEFLATGYGVVADGSTDDRAALQAAIDAAEAAGGGVVLLPEGIIQVGATVINDTSGVTVRGVNVDATIIRGANGVTPVIQMGPTSGFGVSGCGFEDLTVTRSGSPGAGVVGVQINSFNHSAVRNIRSWNHGYCFALLGPSSSIGIGFNFTECQAWGARDAYYWVRSAAGVEFVACYGGKNGYEEPTLPRSCVRFSGDANAVKFTNCTMTPIRNLTTYPSSATALFAFDDYTNATGVIYFGNSDAEVIQNAVISNSGTTIAIASLAFSRSRVIPDGNFFALDAATPRVQQFAFQDSETGAGTFNLAAGAWNRVTGNMMGANVTVSGGSADHDIIFAGNTCAGNLTFSGTFGTRVYFGQVDGTLSGSPTVTNDFYIDQNLSKAATVQHNAIELGNASDTTLTRSGPGRMAVEGIDVALLTAVQTMTNKTLTDPQMTGTLTGTRVEQVGSAAIAAIGNALNTTNKFQGRLVYDVNNNRLMVANGSAASAPWFIADGSGSVTPS